MEIHWLINYNLALYSTIIALILLWRKHGIAAALHPFNYYLATWILSLLSFGLAIAVGLDWFLIEDERLLSQLFFTIAFTGISICFILKFSKKVFIFKDFNWTISEKLLKNTGSIILVLGLFLITTKGFDVAANRMKSVEEGTAAALAGERLGLLGALISVFFMLKMPILIYNGTQFYDMILRKTKPLKLYIFFVLIGSTLESISGGGRAGIVQALTFFAIGVILNHVKSINPLSTKRFIYKTFRISIIPILILSIYINFVASERENHGDYSSVTKEYLSKSIIGEKFFGILEYSIFHILGYQLRMNDTATEELEMGQYTFQFITTFNLPIISQVAKSEINLANLLEFKTIDNQVFTFNAEGKKASSTTATVFFVLFDDFGLAGSLLVIFIFIILTNRIFNRVLAGSIHSFFSLIFLLFFFDLWKNTWFSHHLNGTIFNAYLYPAILLYMIKKIKI